MERSDAGERHNGPFWGSNATAGEWRTRSAAAPDQQEPFRGSTAPVFGRRSRVRLRLNDESTVAVGSTVSVGSRPDAVEG